MTAREWGIDNTVISFFLGVVSIKKVIERLTKHFTKLKKREETGDLTNEII